MALTNCFNAGAVVATQPSFGSPSNIGPVAGVTTGSVDNCYYLPYDGTNSNGYGTEAAAITAAMLGEAFADGDALPRAALGKQNQRRRTGVSRVC